MATLNLNPNANGHWDKISSNYFTAHDATTASVIGDTLYIGQWKWTDGTYHIHRSVLSFDTSGLDDSCIIQSATLTLRTYQDWSSTNFDIIIRSGMPTYPHIPVVNTDYELALYSGNGGKKNTDTLSGEWGEQQNFVINLNATGLGWINKTGNTKIALISSLDVASEAPTGNEYLICFNQAGQQYPSLSIVYYIPTGKPAVDDPTFSDLRKNSVLVTANITNDGETGYEERGFEYGLTETATWTKKETGVFTGTGDFSLTIDEDISLPETYYVRAYVKNSFGTDYSNWVKLEVVEYPEEGDWVAYISYGEWVKFITAAPGSPGDKPSGYKNDICSDDSGYTYILNRSLTDDGASYESHFTLSTDLSGKKTLHTNKRLLDIFSYFANKGTGTAKIYVKRDNEPAWQYAGEISLAGEEEIIIKHLPSENEDTEGDVDYLAKHFLIKFVFENDFEFIGMITEAVGIGDR